MKKIKALKYPFSLYKCDCGVIFKTRDYYILNGHTKSCGCYQKRFPNRKIHGEGQHQTAEYRAWASMKRRCQNPNTKDYKDYGGRGIRICEAWQWYPYFLEDMGRKPSATYSLDRINVNGHYTPDNCRWATPKQQANNTRKSNKVKV